MLLRDLHGNGMSDTAFLRGAARPPGWGPPAGSCPSVWPRWSVARADAIATLVDISGPDLPCARSQTRPCSHGAPRPTSAPHPRGGLLQLLSLQTLLSRDTFSSPLRNSALSQNLATSVLSSPCPSHHRFLPERPQGGLTPESLASAFLPHTGCSQAPVTLYKHVRSQESSEPCGGLAVTQTSPGLPWPARCCPGLAPSFTATLGAGVGHRSHVRRLRSEG